MKISVIPKVVVMKVNFQTKSITWEWFETATPVTDAERWVMEQQLEDRSFVNVMRLSQTLAEYHIITQRGI